MDLKLHLMYASSTSYCNKWTDSHVTTANTELAYGLVVKTPAFTQALLPGNRRIGLPRRISCCQACEQSRVDRRQLAFVDLSTILIHQTLTDVRFQRRFSYLSQNLATTANTKAKTYFIFAQCVNANFIVIYPFYIRTPF